MSAFIDEMSSVSWTNALKTEVLWCSTPTPNSEHASAHYVTYVLLASSVRDLDISIDSNVTLPSHITTLCGIVLRLLLLNIGQCF